MKEESESSSGESESGSSSDSDQEEEKSANKVICSILASMLVNVCRACNLITEKE